MTRKQGEIPGTEPPRDGELDAAAADVYELTAERQAKHENEKLARSKLIELMKAKSVDRYVYIDGDERYDVTLEESEHVKVRKTRDSQTAAAAE